LIIETLYSPTEKDRLSGLAQRIWVHRGTSTSALQNESIAGTSLIQRVPPDTIRVITGFAVTFASLAAEYPTGVKVSVLPSGSSAGAGIMIASVPFPGDFTAGGAIYSGQSVQCWAPCFPGDDFEIICSKSAAVSNATWLFGVFGFEIPRANVRR